LILDDHVVIIVILLSSILNRGGLMLTIQWGLTHHYWGSTHLKIPPRPPRKSKKEGQYGWPCESIQIETQCTNTRFHTFPREIFELVYFVVRLECMVNSYSTVSAWLPLFTIIWGPTHPNIPTRPPWSSLDNVDGQREREGQYRWLWESI